MKKFLSFLALSLFLTGCGAKDSSSENSSPKKGDDSVAENVVSPKALALKNSFTEGEIPANAETLFADLNTESTKKWANVVVGKIPSSISDEKLEESFVLSGKTNIPQMGDASLTLRGSDKVDLSNESDIRMDLDLSLEAAIAGMMSGNGKARFGFIMADNSLFVSLKELALDAPMFGPQIAQIQALTSAFTGNWYTESLSALSEKTGGQIDLKAFLGKMMRKHLTLAKDLREVIEKRDIFVMTKALKNQDGFYRFEVELDRVKTAEHLNRVMSLFVLPKEASAKGKQRIEEFLKTVSFTGTLSYLAKDVQYFTLVGDLTIGTETTKIDATILENEKKIFITLFDKTEISFLATTTNGVTNFSLTTKGEKGSVTGSISETHFDIQTETSFALILDKTGETWAGSLDTKDAGILVNISDLLLTKERFKATFAFSIQGQEKGEISIDASVKESPSLSIIAPTDAKPFAEVIDALNIPQQSATPTPL